MLHNEGAKALRAVASLSDTQWGRTDFLKLLGIELSAAQLFTRVLIDTAQEHLQSMKSTIAV
jgi:hypothetical protein